MNPPTAIYSVPSTTVSPRVVRYKGRLNKTSYAVGILPFYPLLTPPCGRSCIES